MIGTALTIERKIRKINYKIQNFEPFCEANHLEIPENFTKVLENAGFFDFPASIGHHLNCEGGLFNHSMAVAETLLILTARNGLKWSRPSSPALIGLFHDLCKLEAYQVDNSTPYIVGEPTRYIHRDQRNQLYTGHGEKSVLMLAGWMPLTAEEIACIIWHMGDFDDRENWSHYTAAIHQFPNVLWTHQADMIATHILEREGLEG